MWFDLLNEVVKDYKFKSIHITELHKPQRGDVIVLPKDMAVVSDRDEILWFCNGILRRQGDDFDFTLNEAGNIEVHFGKWGNSEHQEYRNGQIQYTDEYLEESMSLKNRQPLIFPPVSNNLFIVLRRVER